MAKPKGNVYPVGKKFRVKFPMGKDPVTGRYRTIQETYPTEDTAWARLNRLRVDDAEGELISPSRMTLAQFAERWLDAKRASVRSSSLRIYRDDVNILNSVLGNVRLVKLDAPAILAWQAKLLETHHPTTVRHAQTILVMMLTDAERWNMLPSSTVRMARDLPKPARVKPELRVWNRAQIETFLRATETSEYGALWRLAITTGMRIGELGALRWTDLFGNRLTIRGTIAQGDDKKLTLNDPKSDAGRRTITLSESTLAMLKRERERQQTYREKVGMWWNEEGWMFPSRSGRLRDTAVMREQLIRICAEAGLPYIGAHGLRHSYGTDLMRAGVPPRVVQQRMGHSDVKVTLNLYSHPDDEMEASVADVIERGFVADSFPKPAKSG